ncbi:cyclic pyranopterin phosphate synthase [Prauserella marina]|uniref:GTP 3',8-cyclase n=1 Tax=Prauserella marina TaxID=530584 RepID=A0A222W0G0_9PSEU|nr:GTP 3',8-cyclase MoaA [Prauserella marina]ASR39630.1 cyclic pyranopterin phosphate synthase [Prauserella marina]PWV75608.1 cyclic pyranopterin monophosphate synthase subunit MoaA [Prauserella marina]SDD30695.1 cyclic pyranopterin phosphate synthase [Prauserella marina]
MEERLDAGPLRDRLGRPLTDVRLSVTDRCNFRCRYCMPRELFGAGHAFLPRSELLSFEEITRLLGVFRRGGVRKVRLTGGEPLLRGGLPDLVAMLSGFADLAMTTNGVLLPKHAAVLARNGLHRVTVSLDALDERTFRAMADTPVALSAVLDGITAAREAGLGVKVNTVVQRGVNDHQIEELAAWARDEGVRLRFIEYMDVGTTNGWVRDKVVPAHEVRERVDALWPLAEVAPEVAGEVATRFRYRDGGGEIGIIASVTAPFCQTCTRARVSAVGELYTCLFAARGLDLRALLRGGATDEELYAVLARHWAGRSDRASELRGEEGLRGPRVEMSYIGG